MDNIISVVTNNTDFYKQVVQLFSSNANEISFEQILPGSSLDSAQIIITDGSDEAVYEEEVPIILIAHEMPRHLTPSLFIRFYKIGEFTPDIIIRDVFEWVNIISTMSELDSEAKNAQSKLSDCKKKLNDYKENLKDAKSLQKEVMIPSKQTDFDIAAHYQSIAQVSGDILLTEEVGEHLFIVIGDVTDHGYLAGLYGASLYASMKSYLTLASSYELTIEGFVRYMQYASSFYQPTGYGSLRQKASATMLFCEIDKKKQEIKFINCGHGNELPVIVRQGKEAFLLSFDSEKSEMLPVIGDFTIIPPTKAISLPFFPGDCIVLYTDGITEIFKDSKNKNVSDEYSSERLLSSVCQEIKKKDWTVESVLQGIKKDAESYAISDDLTNAKSEITDDISMLAIKWKNPTQKG